MQQIIVIHGGTTFSNYDKYLDYLANKPIRIDRLTYSPKWKERLQDQLGADYQILLPDMPNKTNARYAEWEIWFTHLSSVVTDDCILIGHSMGAIFLAKYLSENTFPKKIKATILVASPYDDESEEDLTDFKIEALSDRLTEQAGRLIFFNGSDDPVISMSDIKKYEERLPSAEFNLMSAPDHFVRPDFPELTSLLKEL
ncbi:MAG TPA: alpha/beta hydrolase [Candidatus Microsaccharimonas sp.]|jgi:predicted alpha/beta hydrolase family esterase